MKPIIFVLLFGAALAGCDSSKPAPKPLSSGQKLTDEQARKALNDAEAKNPCSEQNLKKASEAQKNKCDPTRGMMERVNPKTTPRPKK